MIDDLDSDFDGTSQEHARKDHARRFRLGKRTASTNTVKVNKGYSRFIRWMRLVLPFVALTLIAIVFAWSNMSDENIVPLQIQEAAPKTIGKNELLNPRFESTDEKKQPYTITAVRAIQGETNEELIILDEPLADILLNSGNWIALKAKQGAYRQDNQRLLLKGDVRLFHDQGYTIETTQLQLDMEKNMLWSEEAIYAQGPAGSLEAVGMNVNTTTGVFVFQGPAKLILNRSVSNINIGSFQ